MSNKTGPPSVGVSTLHKFGHTFQSKLIQMSCDHSNQCNPCERIFQTSRDRDQLTSEDQSDGGSEVPYQHFITEKGNLRRTSNIDTDFPGPGYVQICKQSQLAQKMRGVSACYSG